MIPFTRSDTIASPTPTVNPRLRSAAALALPIVAALACGCYEYVPTPPTSAYGTITDRDGQPLSGARVTLDTAFAETDAEGRFDVSCDPERECDYFPDLLASADGHATVREGLVGASRTEVHISLPVDDGVPEAASGIPRRRPLPSLHETTVIDERRSGPEDASPTCTPEERGGWRPGVFACYVREELRLLWPCVDDESRDDPAQILCARSRWTPLRVGRLSSYRAETQPPPLVPLENAYRVRNGAAPPLWVELDDGTVCVSFMHPPTTTTSDEAVPMRCSAYSDASSRVVETVLIGDVIAGPIATVVQGGIDAELADGRVRVLGRRIAEVATIRR